MPLGFAGCISLVFGMCASSLGRHGIDLGKSSCSLHIDAVAFV